MGPVEAAQQAIANPLLNLSIEDARGVLFSVKGGESLTLGGINAAGELIASAVHKDAHIFFGMSLDQSLGDEVRLTLIATGLRQAIVGEASPGGLGGLLSSIRGKFRNKR